MIELHQIITIASKEFKDRLRNRWVLGITIVFALFSLIIAYFGAAQQGTIGFRSIEITIASLVSLVIYLIPLIALILGFDAIVGERECGSLDLLLTMPITRLELILGKYLGLSAALTLSIVIGFGLAGMTLLNQMSITAMMHYSGFILSSILLGMAFLSLAIMLSVFSKNRAGASGLAIATWFFFVLIFDLLLLSILVISGGYYGGEVFPYLMLLNPTDVFRILNIFSLEDVRTLYGMATVFPEQLSHPALLSGVMFLWITIPLAITFWRFKQ